MAAPVILSFNRRGNWVFFCCCFVCFLNGNPLQCSCLENPMNGGAWWAAVHGVARGRTGLSDFTFTFHFHALEKEIATHSSTLAWRIPWMEEPGGLQSMGSLGVGHNWVTSLPLLPCHVAYGILVPWPVMEPALLTLEAWSLNHWTTRKFQKASFKVMN